MPARTVRLTGWGRVSASWAELAKPATAAAAAELLGAGPRCRPAAGPRCGPAAGLWAAP